MTKPCGNFSWTFILLLYCYATNSFQCQGKAMPKNVQTTVQLHSSHMLASDAQNFPSQASTVHEL